MEPALNSVNRGLNACAQSPEETAQKVTSKTNFFASEIDMVALPEIEMVFPIVAGNGAKISGGFGARKVPKVPSEAALM
jgi:hypothetical protein